jgi:hypothetical protein
LNPTNCQARHVVATIAGVGGERAEAASRFTVGGCGELAFKPTFQASTNAHTSYAGGASLDVKLTFPKAAHARQANLARLKVTLPKQLSTRLTTLQGSCPERTFDANPAACPATAIVGVARARTPTVPGGMAGPVYLVAHGPNVFPSPVLMLEGDGVALELSGSSGVSRAATSVAVRAAPDIPVESIEIDLPQGPHSLLSANTNLCSARKTGAVARTNTRRTPGRVARPGPAALKRPPVSLPMRVSLVAQNGIVLHTAAKVAVRGCGARLR